MPLGKLSYGVAISDDGKRVAFATMRSDCQKSPAIYTCPVTLYGVDVGDGVAHRIAGTDHDVTYAPKFVDPHGNELVFMTSEGDDSPECRKRFATDCSYRVVRASFDGTGATTLASDAILPTPARDAIGFRRDHRREAPSGLGAIRLSSTTPTAIATSVGRARSTPVKRKSRPMDRASRMSTPMRSIRRSLSRRLMARRSRS